MTDAKLKIAAGFIFLLIIWGCGLIDDERISVSSVKVENGIISGTTGVKPSVMVFKGIPFAAPPVEELRWREPQPVENWQGVLVCDSYGPNAMQDEPVPFSVYTEEFLIPADGEISEDCLYLNVWTAAKTTGDKLPVIVFIHGGAFTSGGGSVPVYNGEAMAQKGVVFITINYRLGVFGFLAHPELSAEAEYNASGNYGILDQIAALVWIRDNIKAFGGDPGNVTIAGQSAGAISVNALAASPLASGLFHKMIAQSGASVLEGSLGSSTTRKEAEARAVELAEGASLDELRAMPPKEVMDRFGRVSSVIADGYVIPEPVPEIFAGGGQADVPLLTGWNIDDVLFAMPVTLDEYLISLSEQFGEDADLILGFYPASNDKEAVKAYRDLSRDRSFGVQNYAWARLHSENCSTDAWLYFFERKVPEYDGTEEYGGFHSAEITYAFDNHHFFARPWEPGDFWLAILMSSYWANFASTGNPNGEGLPYWPAFDKDEGVVMSFNTESSAVRHPNYQALEFLYQRATK